MIKYIMDKYENFLWETFKDGKQLNNVWKSSMEILYFYSLITNNM